MFATFRDHTRGEFLVGNDPNLQEVARGATVFGFEPGCDIRARDIRISPEGSTFTVDGNKFHLAIPGRYNVANALAAIAACRELDISWEDMVAPLADFRGVTRRFQTVGVVHGVEIIDDFAHNPDKIGAALTTAQARVAHDSVGPHSIDLPTRGRVLAVFQPHGFGPTRFLKDALIEAFVTHLRSDDRLWLPEIYYAGGSVTRDISARDIVTAVTAQDLRAEFIAERADIVPVIAAEACPGDIVLVMGARDPSLTDFCHAIMDALPKYHRPR
jgi:UDP-N-acetylmuramate--alanine ligase